MESLLELALKAKIPYIGVRTDDLIHYQTVLQLIAQKQLAEMPIVKAAQISPSFLYFAPFNEKTVTEDLYRRLESYQASCIIINSDKNPLIFDAGILPTPSVMLEKLLSPFIESELIPGLIKSLQGLSFKASKEVIKLTMARSQVCTSQEIRETRMMLSGNIPGLDHLDTSYDFYLMPKEVENWLSLNNKYFLDPKTPKKLMPRGLMAVGDPGVGKSMLAKVVARHWNIPLFRINIGSLLNRFIGESENRFLNLIRQVELSSPCVILLDEVEKLFVATGDEGTIRRLLSQILWWLEYHEHKILTIMTSNDLSNVPKELYRPGRIDKVITMEKLSLPEAKNFSLLVYNSILKKMPVLKHRKVLWETIAERGLEGTTKHFSHSEVVEIVSTLIKEKNWMTELEEVIPFDKLKS
jgi:hypothetical protein